MPNFFTCVLVALAATVLTAVTSILARIGRLYVSNANLESAITAGATPDAHDACVIFSDLMKEVKSITGNAATLKKRVCDHGYPDLILLSNALRSARKANNAIAGLIQNLDGMRTPSQEVEMPGPSTMPMNPCHPKSGAQISTPTAVGIEETQT